MIKIQLDWVSRFRKALTDDVKGYFSGFFISPFKVWMSVQERDSLSPLEVQTSIEISKNFLLDLYTKTTVAKLERDNLVTYINRDNFVQDINNALSSEKLILVVPEFKIFIELRASFEILILFFEEDEKISTSIILSIKEDQYIIRDSMGIRFENTNFFKRTDLVGLSKITHQENQHIWFLFDPLIKTIEYGDADECNPKFISVFDRWLQRDEVKSKLDDLTKDQHIFYTKRLLCFFKTIYKQHSIYVYVRNRPEIFLLKNDAVLDFYIDDTYKWDSKNKPIFLVPSLSLVLMLSGDHIMTLFGNDELDSDEYLKQILKSSTLYVLG